MNSTKELQKVESQEEQVEYPKGHPIYSVHRRNFASINPVAPEALYSITMWLSVIGFVIILALIFGGVSLITGCDDTPTPSDKVADADTYTTEVVDGDTVDISNDTDATDTNNVDVVEVEVVSDPCADYMYITNPMWCCGENDACYWEDACKIYEKNEECLFICEKFTNGYEASVTDTLFEFNFPDIIRYSTSGTVTCVSQ